MPLDNRDRLILGALRENGRITNTELAESIALSPSPCLRRVRSLESDGLIRGYRADLDPKALGWQITAIVHLKSHKAPRPDIAADLAASLDALPQVVWAFGVAGSADIIVQLVAKDFDDYFQQIQQLAAIDIVSDLESFIAVTEVKSNKGVPIP